MLRKRKSFFFFFFFIIIDYDEDIYQCEKASDAGIQVQK